MELGKRLRDGVRRDSGYSPKEDSESDSASPDKESDIVTRNSCDSGLGSPSPSTAPTRRWGRRCTRQAELRALQQIQRSLQDLAASFGGEVAFTYTPRHHPNLPNLNTSQTKLLIPMKEVGLPSPEENISTEPGQFLKRTGLSSDDILENRFPDIPFGGLAVVSNGLALDLVRLADTVPDNGPTKITKFIFNFLEVKFPSELEDKACTATLNYISENQNYVDQCEDKREVTNFLLCPFILPDEVSDMASVVEDLETESDEVENDLASLYPELYLQPGKIVYDNGIESSDSYVMENSMVCGIKLVDDEGGYELSSVEDVYTDNGGYDAKTGLDNNETWTAQEVDYKVIHTEDENFSLTATVVSLDSQLGQLMAASVECPADQMDVKNVVKPAAEDTEVRDLKAEPESPEVSDPHAQSGEVRKRSRTREVQIPTRFKDFDTVSPYKRSKQT